MPVYYLKDKEKFGGLIVDARSEQQAHLHVSRKTIDVKTINASDIAALVMKGVRVEKAGLDLASEPEPAEVRSSTEAHA